MVFFKIFVQIFRNRTLFLAGFVNIFSSCLFYNIYVSHKFTILTNREMNRRNFFAIKFCKLFYNFTVTYVIHVHVCYENHTRQFIFFTEIPCLLCSNLNAGFTGYYDDCCVCCAYSFLYFSHKIKVSRCIQHIDFYFIPRYGNECCRNGELSLNFFLIIIADSIAIFYSSETACHT